MKRKNVSQRGAVFAEAIIMLPVFTIVFFGVMYLKDSVVASEVNLSRARDCAWEFSNSACPKDDGGRYGSAYTMQKGCTIDPGEAAFSNTPDRLFTTGVRGGEPGTSSVPTCPKATAENANSASGDETGICGKVMDSQKSSKGGESEKGAKLREKTGGFLDMVADLFENERHTVAAASELTTPRILGANRVRVSSAFRVSCNTKQQTVFDYIKDLLSAVNPF